MMRRPEGPLSEQPATRPGARPPSAAGSPRAPPRGSARAGSWAGGGRASSCPAPGEPTSSRLCPPAAATSSARRAWCCPRTSARSTDRGLPTGVAADLDPGCAPTAAEERTTCSRLDTATTRRPSTCAASTALASGTTTPSRPACAAAIATESTPGVGMTSPFSDSSPKNTAPSADAVGHLSGGEQHARRDRQVEARALLAEVAGRQVDDDAPQAAIRAPRARRPDGSDRAHRPPPRPEAR